MAAKKVEQSEVDVALELAHGICDLVTADKSLRARVCGANGYEVTITEARVGHLDHKLVLKGDVYEGDKAFGWKGIIPGLKVKPHSKGIRFTAAGMPSVIVYT